MAAYFGGVVPAGLLVRVVQEATQLVDAELPGDAVHGADRDLAEIVQKRAEEPGCTELDRKSEAVMIAAVEVDDTSVAIVQVEVAVQLFPGGFSGEASVSAALVIGQEADGHISPVFRGR